MNLSGRSSSKRALESNSSPFVLDACGLSILTEGKSEKLLGSPLGLDKGINEVKGWVVNFFLLSKEEGKEQQFIDESL